MTLSDSDEEDKKILFTAKNWINNRWKLWIYGQEVGIISKIESQEGIDNLEEILELSDGLMVARGDMGVEIPLEQVPIVQKHMIKRANEVGKPIITATQMLESMTSKSKTNKSRS